MGNWKYLFDRATVDEDENEDEEYNNALKNMLGKLGLEEEEEADDACTTEKADDVCETRNPKRVDDRMPERYNPSNKVLNVLAMFAKDGDVTREDFEDVLENVAGKDGGKDSGNFGHKGRPGQRGGSGKGEGGAAGSALEKQKAEVAAGKEGAKVTAGVKYWANRGGKTMTHAEALKAQKARQTSGGSIVKKASRAQIKDAKAYSSGAGVATKTLANGSGITKIDPNDIKVSRNASTLANHSVMLPDGSVVLTPEREKMHQAAIDDLFRNAKKPGPGEKKVFTMLGGGSAAGKGSIQKSGQVNFPTSEQSPVIDPDELKKEIPEFVSESDRDAAAAYGHEESSAMAKRAMQAAFQNGYNCTLDGTGDGNINSLRKKINDARKAGYEVNATYVTCPTDLAVERSNERGKKIGRVVPENAVRDIHRNVSRIFPQIASEFDHVELYDTNQGKDVNGKWNPPKLIASCKRGQQIQIHDPELYKAFLDKGNE